MTTATRRLTEAMIYWNSEDPEREYWSYRIKYDDGCEENDEWTIPYHGLAMAVIMLVRRSTTEFIKVKSGDVIIDGLCGTWMRPNND